MICLLFRFFFRLRHKQNGCCATDSVGLIFTRSYCPTLLILTPTMTPSLENQPQGIFYQKHCLSKSLDTAKATTRDGYWGYPIPQYRKKTRVEIDEMSIPHLDPFIIGHAYLKELRHG